jgi:hypothetical protein
MSLEYYASVKMVSLEDLIPDILFSLLIKTPSINILWGFIRASPRMFSVFRTHRQIILSTVITHEIGSSILVDAQAALQSSRFTPRGLLKTECLEWIKRYQHQLLNKSSVFELSPGSDMIDLWQNHRDVKVLAELFVQERLHVLNGVAALPCIERPTQRNYTLEDLSDLERFRLFRGIYRYAVYGDLFHYYEDRNGLGAHDQAHSFLVLFSAWEVEELSCINDFIHDRILQKWQEVEDTAFNIIARDSSSWGNLTLSGFLLI